MSLPQFLVVVAAEYLPRDALVSLSLVSRGGSIVAHQELHHRRRSRPHPPTGCLKSAMASLPLPIARILHRWHIHLDETVGTAETPLHRRVSIPGMEFGGEIAEKIDIEWGVKFPGREAENIFWKYRVMFGDGQDEERPCAFLGCGVIDAQAAALNDSFETPPAASTLYCVSVTCAKPTTATVGGVTYITVSLLFDKDGYVVDLTWCFALGASSVHALRSDSCANELIFSSHPTVFSHLHSLMGMDHSDPTKPVPMLNLKRFRIPLPPRSNSSSFSTLVSLFEAASSYHTFVAALDTCFVSPITNSVNHIDDDLYTVVGLTKDFVTPKGIWKLDSGEADISKVNVVELWRHRSEKQLKLAAKGYREVQDLFLRGVIPLSTMLCMDIYRSDPMASPSQVWLA